jgi:S1-C subfamily serine protease
MFLLPFLAAAAAAAPFRVLAQDEPFGSAPFRVLAQDESFGSAPFRVLAQDEPDKAHVRLYRKVAPAVVYVEGGGRTGSGVIIDKSGLVLTSPTACGNSAKTVNVLLKGGQWHRCRVLGRVNDLELVLVKVDAGRELPAVELGDSDAARVGQVSYVFGDCFDSIKSDDQPAMSLGVISAIYETGARKLKTFTGGKAQESSYRGKVLETSAAVNPNQDGGALVDREGRLLGLITLDYDESKFTGIAVPINVLKPQIERILKEGDAPAAAPEAPARGEAWLGLEVRPVKDGLEVTRVARRGPAEKAGVQKGDVLEALDSAKTPTEAALEAAVRARGPGVMVRLSLLREGTRTELAVRLAAKPVY